MGIYSSISIEDLLRRCSESGDIAAWEEFVRRFHRLIATVVLRTAARWGNASKQTADDLIQETYLRFCANDQRILREFDHRGADAFVAYVKVITANVVRDHFKSSYSKKRGSNQIEGISDEFTPAAGENAAGSPKAIERAVLIQEVQSHLSLCVAGAEHDRNCKIFWLYYRAGLSAAAIAAIPGIGLTTKGVESLILRITRELRARMATPKLGVRENLPAESKGILRAKSF
jgi:RNA polymerase sigma-70 factor (ECF subfamily)